MVLEVIQREIPLRGVGYIILRDCPEDRQGEALGKGMEKLKKSGAKTVLATSLPEGEPLHPGPVGVWRLTHVHDLIRMECPLSPARPKPDIRLNLRSPKRAADEKAYLDLANQAYLNVPNAVTLRSADLRLPNHRFALAYQGEQPIGLYGLDLSEKTPELTTLAVTPPMQRHGFGRSLLRSAMDSLGGKTPACALTVSSANTAALALLESEGFSQVGVVSSWYEVV